MENQIAETIRSRTFRQLLLVVAMLIQQINCAVDCDSFTDVGNDFELNVLCFEDGSFLVTWDTSSSINSLQIHYQCIDRSANSSEELLISTGKRFSDTELIPGKWENCTVFGCYSRDAPFYPKYRITEESCSTTETKQMCSQVIHSSAVEVIESDDIFSLEMYCFENGSVLSSWNITGSSDDDITFFQIDFQCFDNSSTYEGIISSNEEVSGQRLLEGSWNNCTLFGCHQSGASWKYIVQHNCSRDHEVGTPSLFCLELESVSNGYNFSLEVNCPENGSVLSSWNTTSGNLQGVDAFQIEYECVNESGTYEGIISNDYTGNALLNGWDNCTIAGCYRDISNSLHLVARKSCGAAVSPATDKNSNNNDNNDMPSSSPTLSTTPSPVQSAAIPIIYIIVAAVVVLATTTIIAVSAIVILTLLSKKRRKKVDIVVADDMAMFPPIIDHCHGLSASLHSIRSENFSALQIPSSTELTKVEDLDSSSIGRNNHLVDFTEIHVVHLTEQKSVEATLLKTLFEDGEEEPLSDTPVPLLSMSSITSTSGSASDSGGYICHETWHSSTPQNHHFHHHKQQTTV